MIEETILQLTALFEPFRNAKRAQTASAYMKNHFPFIGMKTEIRRSAQKSWIDSLKTIDDRKLRWSIIRALWEKEERDYHYVAVDLLNSWPKRFYSEEDAVELEWLLNNKSWWDSVDAIASNYLGRWALLFPEKARETFEKWRYHESFWLQRSCLIYQLKYKDQVDSAYLENLIQQLNGNKEFFIQKAIGWSLRQLSKYKPEDVVQILANNPIKGLALREASKYLS
ncbi:DNA alkylation repair protein [Fluviicola chungangensis]|uniref:DNA alkylation repair protein n=1 Tax=Fluviicola chungangensis TaxID=2597671 RepID=A0A556MP28_9FLAO|nr:DNA alkylation repair protein [Fluviicola chungangensis]TSJ41693.1 DNA alkylation repair protein [Fluviicola chungangensis]